MNTQQRKEMDEARERFPETYRYTVCPVCSEKTLDNHWICPQCGWEHDGAGENEYSACNGATLAEYRGQYKEKKSK